MPWPRCVRCLYPCPTNMEGVLVQLMVSGGVGVMVRVTADPMFGPLIAFGLEGYPR